MFSDIYCKTNQTLSLNFKIVLMDDHESVLNNSAKILMFLLELLLHLFLHIAVK